MSKRYEEPADVEAPDGRIESFWWRGRRYRVREVLGRWREAGGWWESPADTAQPWARGSSREIWRVDACFDPNGSAESRPRHPAGRNLRRLPFPTGTYELCRDLRKGTWSLHRVWD